MPVYLASIWNIETKNLSDRINENAPIVYPPKKWCTKLRKHSNVGLSFVSLVDLDFMHNVSVTVHFFFCIKDLTTFKTHVLSSFSLRIAFASDNLTDFSTSIAEDKGKRCLSECVRKVLLRTYSYSCFFSSRLFAGPILPALETVPLSAFCGSCPLLFFVFSINAASVCLEDF